MPTIPELLANTVDHHQAGRFQEAERGYRQILQLDPNDVNALHLLGVLCQQQGHHDRAVDYISAALRRKADFPEAHNNLGNALRAQGRLDEAVASYHQALFHRPDYTQAYNNLGIALTEQGRLEEAVASYRRALRLKPDNAGAHNNLGVALKNQGSFAEAVACFQQALRIKPNYPEAHDNLGNVLKKQGKLAEAVASHQQALRLKPDFAEAHNNLGNALREQERLGEAVASIQQALRLKPSFAEAHSNLGNALQDQGKLEEAAASFHQALHLKPDFAEAHYNLGNVLREQGRLPEAVASLRQALRLNPSYAEAHNNLGNALREQGRLEEAAASFQQALRLKPNYAEAHNNVAVLLREGGKVEEALASYQQALKLKPDYAEAHKNLGMAWLLLGNFEQGWPEYEWRLQQKNLALPRLPQPLWDGGPLRGRTILLHAEQGLGDTLQLIRYAPLVKQRGGRVLLGCPPQLEGLLAHCPGVDLLISEGTPLPAFDVYAPLMSVPGLLKTMLANIPANVPYLSAGADLVRHWRDELAPVAGFKIGIIWQGNPRHKGDRQRSVPLSRFACLAKLEGVRLCSLQVGPGSEQLRDLAWQGAVMDLGSRLDSTSLADAAAVIVNLDLVIAVDTALAHLAGALGVPVWVALPYSPDWRWLLDREDSPWYPTMRLFRQTDPGNWVGVFERLVAEVRRLLQASPTDVLPPRDPPG